MRISIALAAIAIGLPAAAQAAPRWTFCVAASKSGADVWITDVFAAERDRVELENAFKAMIGRAGAAAPTPSARSRSRTEPTPSTPSSRPSSSTAGSAPSCMAWSRANFRRGGRARYSETFVTAGSGPPDHVNR